MSTFDFRFIAFYLPQFYPIPENNKWWGEGFTEWFNVVKTKPRFKGHYQPRLPGELGFYDLRVFEVKEQQAILAKEYGISGFAYYHYWFSGKRVLNRPLDDMIETNKPDFPFCLVWANESWSRRWGPTYGSRSLNKNIGETLIEQKYGKNDDLNHIRWLLKIFTHKNYIRVDGKPVFIIYRPSLLPNLKKTAEIWRKEAVKFGFKGLYLCLVHSFPEDYIDPNLVGFDAAIGFVPDIKIRNSVIKETKGLNYLNKVIKYGFSSSSEILIPYERIIKESLKSISSEYKKYPCIMPNWDNSSRRSVGATIYINSTPDRYKYWLIKTMQKFRFTNKEENFIFINSWNEWAEGSNLEPDLKFRRSYLDAHKQGIIDFNDKLKK